MSSLGEGVFGLRRAFALAGARTLVMSLWPVGDREAREWASSFYRAGVAQGLPTAEACRVATRAVLEARRKDGRSLQPHYWAPFLAAGDWR